jgi:hypothetical protein
MSADHPSADAAIFFDDRHPAPFLKCRRKKWQGPTFAVAIRHKLWAMSLNAMHRLAGLTAIP